MTDSLEVYFDGACPLCVREIEFYRRQRGADRIIWTDISTFKGSKVATNLTKEMALRRFHVKDKTGQLVSGAKAFSKLWQELPRFRLFGRFAGVTPITEILEAAYRAFLLFRPTLQGILPRNERCDQNHGCKA
ncbi:MAG: DUF393 domain-containing protein [Marinicaulis sp.]|nr:DUF393 domain-containing protein [Marinicaulis sp.]